MKKNLENRLKMQFAHEFSLLYKNWEKKPYYVFAETAAENKQFARLPIDMLLFSLDIQDDMELEVRVFDFLSYNGCKEYDDYIFEQISLILEKIRHIKLQSLHISSLCKFINKKCWEKGNITEGICIANALLQLNAYGVKKEFVWCPL